MELKCTEFQPTAGRHRVVIDLKRDPGDSQRHRTRTPRFWTGVYEMVYFVVIKQGLRETDDISDYLK